MSHNNCILTLLDLKDKNITFSENWMKDVQINGIRSKVISGILSFQPTHCYNCGHLFDSQIIKHGFKTSRIKMMKLSGFDTYLDLKKQRYKLICTLCQGQRKKTKQLEADFCILQESAYLNSIDI
ncbi:transposase family protein [Turicibacter bilis]|uniref:Transposase n=1 Tax=Turicibacter bilis TaxID=2735723 RepID=A0ABY5JMW1_9FIRM|nr:transposase family protein [Turicibacter bilis]UUF06892.1 transposase [Turicibacter bilis]